MFSEKQDDVFSEQEQVKFPLQNNDMDSIEEDTNEAECASTCCFLKDKDVAKQRDIVYSVCMYCTYFILGWSRGLISPALPDILRISEVDIGLGSWIVKTFFFGYLLGSLSGGFIHGKMERNLPFIVTMIALALSVVGTPWCFLYELMIIVHFLQGFCQGLVQTIANTEILDLWKSNRKLYFLSECCFWFGSFFSPLAAAPFLMEVPGQDHSNGINYTHTPYTSIINNRTDFTSAVTFAPNSSMLEASQKQENIPTSQSEQLPFKSMIYVPYSITSFLSLLVAALFCAVFLIYRNVSSKSSYGEKDTTTPKTARVLPVKLKMFSLVIMGILFFIYVAVTQAFAAYLTVFSVNYLGWSPSDGALLSSVTNISGIPATILSLFINCLNTLVYAGINCTMLFLSFVGLLIGSLFYNEPLVWISCCVHGYFRSIVFSLFFTWTNDYITQATSGISSLFMIVSCLGAAINPVLLGYIMEEFGDIWLIHISVIEGAVTLLVYITAIVLTKYIVKNFGKTFETPSITSMDESQNTKC